MMHQMAHVLEEQRMSMDQYLMMMREVCGRVSEESLKPDAEKRVHRQLVLDEIIKQEGIQVAPDELESIFRCYAQMGQELPRTQEQVGASRVACCVKRPFRV